MYHCAGRFAQRAEAFPLGAIAYLAQQTGTEPSDLETYDWSGRTARRHRADILEFLGIQRLTGRVPIGRLHG